MKAIRFSKQIFISDYYLIHMFALTSSDPIYTLTFSYLYHERKFHTTCKLLSQVIHRLSRKGSNYCDIH